MTRDLATSAWYAIRGDVVDAVRRAEFPGQCEYAGCRRAAVPGLVARVRVEWLPTHRANVRDGIEDGGLVVTFDLCRVCFTAWREAPERTFLGFVFKLEEETDAGTWRSCEDPLDSRGWRVLARALVIAVPCVVVALVAVRCFGN